MTSNKAPKQSQPSFSYQLAESENLELLNKAFDVLFEETLKQNSDLTAMDN